MKKLILLATLFCFCVGSNFAQDGERFSRNNKERIEALKIGFITEKLRLTPEESQGFWPIYRQMHEEFSQVRKKERISLSDIEKLSETEANQLIEHRLDAEEKLLAIKKEYAKKLRKVLPAKKVAMIKPVESAFRKELLHKVKRGRKNYGQGRQF